LRRSWASRRTASSISEIGNPNVVDAETEHRLNDWCTVDNGARFGRYCIKGANEGKSYGIKYKDDIDSLNKINDFEWLREQFVASMKKRIDI